jgi:hypothetical protein
MAGAGDPCDLQELSAVVGFVRHHSNIAATDAPSISTTFC